MKEVRLQHKLDHMRRRTTAHMGYHEEGYVTLVSKQIFSEGRLKGRLVILTGTSFLKLLK